MNTGGKPLRIASYNIRKAVGLDWRRDPDRIIEVLQEIDADVVVLQEADKRVGARSGVLPLDRLEQELNYVLPDVSIRPQSHGWHGNAILIRGPLNGTSSHRIDLPSAEPRGAVSVFLEERKLEVIGVHLGLTPGVRRKQMLALQEVVKTRLHFVVVAGDFNEWNSAKLPFDQSLNVVSPGPSFHAARPAAALDRFVVSGNLPVVSSHVHTSELSVRASDHLPVVLDLYVPESGT